MLLDVTWTEKKKQTVDIKMAMVLVSELDKRGIKDVNFTLFKEESSNI